MKLHAQIEFSIDKMVSCPVPMTELRADAEKIKGSITTNCFEKWASFTQDHFVLHIVKLDLAIKFAEVSVCQCVPPLNFSPSKTKLIDAEISKLPIQDVIGNTTRETNDYISGVLIRTKKDGDYRVILNLKRFNKFLKFKHCKRE